MSIAPTATFSEAVVPSTASFTVKDSERELGGRHGELQQRRHGRDVHADERAGGGHHLHRDGQRGADQFGQTMAILHLHVHHQQGVRLGRAVPVRDLAGRGAVRRDGRDRHQRGRTGRAVPGHAERDDHGYPVLQGAGQHRHPHWQPVDRPAGRSWRLARSAASPPQGWQELDFSTPVPVTAGTTYVASYHTSAGHYADTPSGLSLGGDERAADRAGQRRGLRLRLGHAFPSNSYNGSNYWVDVVYTPSSGARAPTVTSVDAGVGVVEQSGVDRADGRRSPQPVVPSTASFTVKDSSGNTVPGSACVQQRRHGRDVHADRARWRRAPPIPSTVSGAQNSSGQTMTTYTYTFTTSKAFDAGGQCPCAIWPDAAPSGRRTRTIPVR